MKQLYYYFDKEISRFYVLIYNPVNTTYTTRIINKFSDNRVPNFEYSEKPAFLIHSLQSKFQEVGYTFLSKNEFPNALDI